MNLKNRTAIVERLAPVAYPAILERLRGPT